jgi:hypothetical protein
MNYYQIAEMFSKKQSVVHVKATAEEAVALYRKEIIELVASVTFHV